MISPFSQIYSLPPPPFFLQGNAACVIFLIHAKYKITIAIIPIKTLLYVSFLVWPIQPERERGININAI